MSVLSASISMAYNLIFACVLCRSMLRAAPLALQRRAVKQWLAQQPCMQRSINFGKVEAVLSLLGAPNHSMTMTLAYVPRQQLRTTEADIEGLLPLRLAQEVMDGKASRRSARKRGNTNKGQAVAAVVFGDCVQIRTQQEGNHQSTNLYPPAI